MRYGWLPPDESDWRGLLAALSPDVDWLNQQWALADGPPPRPPVSVLTSAYVSIDIPWVTTELVRG